MFRQGRRAAPALSQMMASTPTPVAVAPMSVSIPDLNTTTGSIPLLCSVCPDIPRFSDVSHLLTHIASKGHLHHETQTKLKAHQDISASAALQDYERWYRDNRIETLLVERMRVKQVKEATRGKRGCTGSVAPVERAKPKTRRSYTNAGAKLESDDPYPEFPLFPGFLHSQNESPPRPDSVTRSEMMSLKGQVWPGMGKMDLANEEMRRTRNQRKPESAIDKMRRTSEGIEPTQVVMTSDLEVETVKGVYDCTSPEPEEEPAFTPRPARPKRKRATALAELSGNVPRGIVNRNSRAKGTRAKKVQKQHHGVGHDENHPYPPTELSNARCESGFGQEDIGGFFRSSPFTSSLHHGQRPIGRDYDGLPPVNPISGPNVASPSPLGRSLAHHLGTNDRSRIRAREQATSGHDNEFPLGSFAHLESPFSPNEPIGFHSSARNAAATSSHFKALGQDHLLYPSTSAVHARESAMLSTPGYFEHPMSHQYLNPPGANPLFSQDRLFLSPYPQSISSQSLPALAFTPINRGRDHLHPASHDHTPSLRASDGIKLEVAQYDIGHGDIDSPNDPEFMSQSSWRSGTSKDDMKLNDSLSSDELVV